MDYRKGKSLTTNEKRKMQKKTITKEGRKERKKEKRNLKLSKGNMKGKEKIVTIIWSVVCIADYFTLTSNMFISIFVNKKTEQRPSAVPTSPLSNQQIFHHLQTQECLLLCSQGIVLISVLTCEDRHIDRLGTSSRLGGSMKRGSLLRCKTSGTCPRLTFKALGCC